MADDETMDFGRLLQAVPDGAEIAQSVVAAVAAGDLVRRLRDRQNMSQSTLARRAGTTQAHLSEIERGVGRNGPTVGTLSRILRELDDQLIVQSRAERAENLAAAIARAEAEVGALCVQMAAIPNVDLGVVARELAQANAEGSPAPFRNVLINGIIIGLDLAARTMPVSLGRTVAATAVQKPAEAKPERARPATRTRGQAE